DACARAGRRREAPNVTVALAALKDANILLRGEARGRTKGYKRPEFDNDPFVRIRVEGIRAMLSLYADSRSVTYEQWGKSALMAALSMGRGQHCARVLAKLSRDFIDDRKVLPINPYGSWKVSMLADEDLAEDIRMYLQSLGKEITAQKLQQYLNTPEVKLKHGIEGVISHKTACRYLAELGYRFSLAKKGMYTDGHERADVVHHRDKVYLPRLAKLQERAMSQEIVGRRVVIWYHDESIFYAHDRHRKAWYHKDADAEPYRKGEGASFMVADYFSADFGWLRGANGETARR
ncbi:hypothetical protein FB107DRAFT_168280, partial [Schizophyllum commune]